MVRLVPLKDRLFPCGPREWDEHSDWVRDNYPDLWQWLLHPTDDDEHRGSTFYRYNLAVSWIESLRFAAQGEPVLQVPVIAIRDLERDRFRFDNRLLSLLERIELHRLLVCPQDKGGCGHIYYARREDQGHCGNPLCKTRISSRKFYDKPEIKERLKQYYEAKKKAKKKKRAKTASKR